MPEKKKSNRIMLMAFINRCQLRSGLQDVFGWRNPQRCEKLRTSNKIGLEIVLQFNETI